MNTTSLENAAYRVMIVMTQAGRHNEYVVWGIWDNRTAAKHFMDKKVVELKADGWTIVSHVIQVAKDWK